jgi:hypothetical protein
MAECPALSYLQRIEIFAKQGFDSLFSHPMVVSLESDKAQGRQKASDDHDQAKRLEYGGKELRTFAGSPSPIQSMPGHSGVLF